MMNNMPVNPELVGGGYGINSKVEVKPEESAWAKENRERLARYRFKEMADLETGTESLVEKLKEVIDSGDYDTLISDEISGRIPTLVLRKIVEERNKINFSEKKKIDTYFLAAGRDQLDEGALKEFLAKIEPEKRKALVITESINTGMSIEKLIKILEKAGLKKFDIASAIVADDSDWSRRLSKLISMPEEHPWYTGSHRVYCGEKVDSSPSIYGISPAIAGIEKDIKDHKIIGAHPKKIQNIRLKNITNYKPDNEKRSAIISDEATEEQLRDNIVAARKDAEVMAQFILKKVWGGSNE